MRAPLIAIAFLSVVAACGKAQAPRPASPPPVASGASAAADAEAPLPASAPEPASFVTYVTIDASWVESAMTPPPAVMKAWAADPANAALLLPTVRHILIKADKDSPAKVAAARAKAMGIMARLKREDFAKVANDVSEDPGSNKKGGAYPGTFVAMFVDEFRNAYLALAPGETTKQPVRSTFGWHIIKKDPLDDDAISASYKRATALPSARRLAGDIAEKLRPPRAEAAATREVDGAITALLGATAAGDPRRPEVRLVPVDKVPNPPPSRTCEKLVATPRDATVIITSEHESGYIVSKAGPETQTDPAAKATAAIDAPDSAWSYCRPERAGAKLTAAQIREMIEKSQKPRK